jgi:hypothetical protein
LVTGAMVAPCAACGGRGPSRPRSPRGKACGGGAEAAAPGCTTALRVTVTTGGRAALRLPPRRPRNSVGRVVTAPAMSAALPSTRGCTR